MYIFDLVENDNFFKPFCSKNKYIYYDCICELIKKSKGRPVLYEMDARDCLNIYLSNSLLEYVEETDDITQMPITRTGADIIRYFRECGWMSERELGRSGEYETHVTSYCRRIIDFLQDLSEKNNDGSLSNKIIELIKGKITIERKKDIFSIERFSNGISLASSDTSMLDSIIVHTKKFITIENKTAFYRFNDDTYSVMYLGGFATRHQIELLKKIYQLNPGIEYYHFGDIDIGGFFIHQHLCRMTGIPFGLFHMGIEDLKDSGNQSCLKPLEKEDILRAGSLMDIEPYKDVLKVMLEQNIKLEQEIICLRLFSD